MRKLIILASFLVLTIGGIRFAFAISPEEFAANCQKEIAGLEQQAAGVSDAYAKANFFREASYAGFRCIRESITNTPADADPGFDLAVDDLRETTNYVNYCTTYITQKEQEIRALAPMAHFTNLQTLMDFAFACLRTMNSPLHDARIAPHLASNDLSETTILVNHCQQIINELKSQYDPLYCEPKDVSKRNEVLRNLQTVEAWCTKTWNSELYDSSVAGPGFGSDAYGTAALYTNRVCGLEPELDDTNEANTDEPAPSPTEFPLGYAELDCLSIMKQTAEPGSSWQAQKRTIATKDNDYCLLTNTAFVYQDGTPDEELIEERFKVTFLKDDDPRGAKLIAKLKSTEEPDFTFYENLDSRYSGTTERVAGKSYHRNVTFYFPFCVIENYLAIDVPPLEPMQDPIMHMEQWTGRSGQLLSHLSSDFTALLTALQPVCEIGLNGESEYSQASRDKTLANTFTKALIEESPTKADVPIPRFILNNTPSDLETGGYRLFFLKQKGPVRILRPDGISLDMSTPNFFAFADFRPATLELGDGTTVDSRALKADAGTTIVTPGGAKATIVVEVESFITDAHGAKIVIEIQPNSEVVLEPPRSKPGKLYRVTVKSGSVRFVHAGEEIGIGVPAPKSSSRFSIEEGNSGPAVPKYEPSYPIGPHFLPETPSGVSVVSRGTDFSLAYNPSTRMTVVEIYDGSVDAINATTGAILTTLSSNYDSAIKHAEISYDGMVTETIALPGSEWKHSLGDTIEPETAGANPPSRAGRWILLTLVVLGGAGYAAYRKRAAILEFIHKKNLS